MASIFNTVRNLKRLRQIVLILVRHGFGEVVQRTGLNSLIADRTVEQGKSPIKGGVAERLRLVAQDLGPSFVKLGQIISTRSDLVPADIIQELKKLQDDVPPVPFEQMRDHVERELGATLGELFDYFDETPLASASIGQVHRAGILTPTGPRDVVVKIRRPGIKVIIDRDLDLLYLIARALEHSIPETRVYSPVKMVEEFDRAIQAELDFTLEADNAEQFARNFATDPQVRFPVIYRATSSKRVLTMEFLPGRKIYDAIAAGANVEKIAKIWVRSLIQQIFDDGFFHADPHPGNLLILGTEDDPIVAFIDLGMVGRLIPTMRDRTVDLMVAMVRRDPPAIVTALHTLGRPSKRVDRNALEAEISVLVDRYLNKNLGEIELAAAIRDFLNTATAHGLEVPPELLMVGKTLMTVEGVGKEIYPELDLFEEIKPYFLALLKRRYASDRIISEMAQTAVRLSAAASEIPLQLQEILENLQRGSLSLQVHEPALRSAADRLGRHIFSGLGVAAMLFCGAELIAASQPGTGKLFLAGAALWAALHVVVMVWLNRRGGDRDN